MATLMPHFCMITKDLSAIRRQILRSGQVRSGSASPVVGEHGPPLVISPFAVDQQVPGREALPAEAEPLD
jgi:hypothetical protein